MSATLKLVVPTEVSTKSDDVIVHLRFAPNAEIISIDALPEHMKPQAWFDRLHAGASQHYQTRAGGRGFFRLPRAKYDSLLAEAVK